MQRLRPSSREPHQTPPPSRGWRPSPWGAVGTRLGGGSGRRPVAPRTPRGCSCTEGVPGGRGRRTEGCSWPLALCWKHHLCDQVTRQNERSLLPFTLDEALCGSKRQTSLGLWGKVFSHLELLGGLALSTVGGHMPQSRPAQVRPGAEHSELETLTLVFPSSQCFFLLILVRSMNP